MAESPFDVAGIGNAIVDVLAHADDTVLQSLGVAKGVMTLIDADRAEAIYAEMAPSIECSGGSAANTIAGIAGLGGKTAFIGKVKNDQLGSVFRHDLKNQGVIFNTPAAEDGNSTARCMILVTPDAQRTMQTFLGACIELGPEDIDPDIVGRAQVTYLEGYLWDPPQAKEAFRKAATIAHEAGQKVALSLSDPFCVERHRAEFLELMTDHIDILFANEAEITALYQTGFDDAMTRLKGHVGVAALTRGARGSVVVSGDTVVSQTAEPVAAVVDTTGAGDLYAAGFLYGFTQGRDLGTCARLGGICAAEIIGHIGARPAVDLARLVTHTLTHTV
ncbi:adenosine kinase [Telmatospirillum sp.]|uniref:adenosine kinase n=1 Tax=Telmatospirillum sp. TaxID=2079197 RepID=UPI00283EFFB5|nr:adenosine kinase [Telmatospirillum sp.]MDR3436820.1 adenosine kinase [Telmatospirillum sp.]